MMTPIFFNSSSNNYSQYPSHDHYEDHLNNHQFLISPNSQASSSSSSLATYQFLNTNDENEILNPELQPPQHQHGAYNDHRIENCTEKGVEFSTWNKNDMINNSMNNDLNQVKWMSSKMGVMLKMKKPDHMNPPNTYNTSTSTTREVTKIEDRKSASTIEETENSSNSTSSNNNNIIPIRVCSDCNTTKTPLWRSGPRGPKSLCNACGIRQRKARRALAAAESGNNIFMDQSIMVPLKVTKTQHKDHKKINKGHVTKYKKRQYSKQITTTTTTLPPLQSSSSSPSPSSSPPSTPPVRKNCVEEFLVSLSKNLTFYHVFPQDEKEAAILLMALSCGYAHET